MKLKSSSRRKRNNTKSILRLPDLEHAKAAVLNSLNSADAKRGYRHAIDEFVDWYCDAVYRIGITTYQGSDGWVGAPPSPVPPAPSGSLEERLHRLGAPEAFLPLRGARLPVASMSMRIPKYMTETLTHPAQAFDALFFIDAMTPATLIQN